MKIEISNLSNKELEKRNVASWPIWSKEASEFNWHYDSTEECYILEGKVEVSTNEGITVSFGKGDFVTFPQGLSCTWKILEPVKKHYNFK